MYNVNSKHHRANHNRKYSPVNTCAVYLCVGNAYNLCELFSETNVRSSNENFNFLFLQQDCPNGRLTPAKFVDMYKMFFPSGNAEEFCDHVFRTFDMDKNGYIDFKVRHSTVYGDIRVVYFLHIANIVVYKNNIILIQTHVNNQTKYFQINKFKNIFINHSNLTRNQIGDGE